MHMSAHEDEYKWHRISLNPWFEHFLVSNVIESIKTFWRLFANCFDMWSHLRLLWMVKPRAWKESTTAIRLPHCHIYVQIIESLFKGNSSFFTFFGWIWNLLWFIRSDISSTITCAVLSYVFLRFQRMLYCMSTKIALPFLFLSH
jgi:hypothetical protein